MTRSYGQLCGPPGYDEVRLVAVELPFAVLAQVVLVCCA